MEERKPIKKLLGVLPDDDVLAQCIHCGLCLATCPTYELTKLEISSPRGRIRLIKAVARGEMELSQKFADEMNFCLDCQACETACPAGVKYGSMVEAARVEVDNSEFISPLTKVVKKIALKYIVGSKRNLKIFARLLYFYQNFGLQKIVHFTGLIKLFGKNMGEIDKLAPRVSKKFSDTFIPEIFNPNGEVKYKTAMLTGCLMNVMFADVNKDTHELLQKIGCQIYTPKDQVCCGSMQAHNGDFETAHNLAKQLIKVFSREEYDYLISNSAGCGAFMKEYGSIFKDDPEYSERAKSLSSKVKDITEFLSEENPEIVYKTLEQTATYHDACHLAHTQKIVSQPRTVLSRIPGLNMVPLEESTWCCGSAGTYNIIQHETSMKILDRKMENIKNTGAGIVITGNPGCMRQIEYGAKRFKVAAKVLHPATVLNRVVEWNYKEKK
ncbi:MAG: (Fe-S)-binding protein [Ignavibacteriaceae bacterium]|nr:(Fe-S)-binding protein [Ignavibacteriaceae bacterium]